MNKNIKSIFFVLTIFALLVAASAVSAADDVNTTSTSTSYESDYQTIDENANTVDDNIISTYKANTYTITATLISTDYGRMEDSKNLTVTKA